MMKIISKSLLLLVLPLFVASCSTTSITNLTPSTLPRNATGQYMIEMEIDTTQQIAQPQITKPPTRLRPIKSDVDEVA